MGFDVGGLLSGLGGSMQKNAQGLQAGTLQRESPTSSFVQAARQAQLERQQAQAAQVQTAPTALAATQGGTMTPMGGIADQARRDPGALAGTNATFQPPPGGMVTQGQPDPALLAAMYRGY